MHGKKEKPGNIKSSTDSNSGDDEFEKILKAEGITKKHLVNEEKATKLHLAAKYNMFDNVKSLLINDADINAVDIKGYSALHYAVEAGHPEMGELLVNLGINPNIKTKSGNTALHIAVIKFQPACIEILLTLDNPIDDTIKNKKHHTAKMLIKFCEDPTQAVKLATAFAVQKNMYASSHLHLAVINNDIAAVGKHLSLCANVNVKDKRGNTPLHYAAANGYLDILQLLCSDKKVNVNTTNKVGDTALHSLMKSNKSEPACIAYLMKANINKPKRNQDGKRAEDYVRLKTNENLRKQLLLALTYTESITANSVNNDKLKSLQDKLPNLNLRSVHSQVNRTEIIKDACSFKAKRDVELPQPVLNVPGVLLHFDPQELKGEDSLNKIKFYLQNGGDPDIEIMDEEICAEKQTLIMYCLRLGGVDSVIVELLRYGAKFKEEELNKLDKENGPYFKKRIVNVLNELSRSVKHIQVLTDTDIDRESQIIQKSLEKLLVEPNQIQRAEVEKRNSKSLFQLFEIKKLSETKGGQIPFKMIYKICNINQGLNDDGTLNKEKMEQLQVEVLGLLSLYSPGEILKSLLKVFPLLTNTQRLFSLLLVKELLINSMVVFGYDLFKEKDLFEEYIKLNIGCNISENLINIYRYSGEFQKHPDYLNYLNFNTIASKYLKLSEFSIDETIDTVANNPKQLETSAKKIANELVILTAKFYHSCPLMELRNIGKEGKDITSKGQFFGPLLTAFVEYSILKQDTFKKRCHIMKLFLFVANECLNDIRMPEINSAGSIMTAFTTDRISKLKLLLDKQGELIHEDLQKLVSHDGNYKMYAEFQAEYSEVLPWLYLVSHKVFLMEDFNTTIEQFRYRGKFYKQFIPLKNRVDFLSLICGSDLHEQIMNSSLLEESKFDELFLKAQSPKSPNLSEKYSLAELQNMLGEQIAKDYPLTVLYDRKEYRNADALKYIRKYLDEHSELKSGNVFQLSAYEKYVKDYTLASSESVDRKKDSMSNKPASFFGSFVRRPTLNREGSVSGSQPPSPKDSTSSRTTSTL